MKIGAVIVASGYGSLRLIRGERFPKVLEMIGGMPMVCRIAHALLSHYTTMPCVVVVNPLFGPRIRAALEDLSFNFLYATQRQRRGSADAVMQALPLLETEGITDFICIYADMPLWEWVTVTALMAVHQTVQPTISLVSVALNGHHPKELERYGRIVRRDGRIWHIVESTDATKEELAIRVVNPSLWIWQRDWFAANAHRVPEVSRQDGFPAEQYMPPLIGIATQDGRLIAEMPLDDPCQALGVNTSWELEIVREIFQARYSQSSPSELV